MDVAVEGNLQQLFNAALYLEFVKVFDTLT
jgi:hypothetical protein